MVVDDCSLLIYLMMLLGMIPCRRLSYHFDPKPWVPRWKCPRVERINLQIRNLRVPSTTMEYVAVISSCGTFCSGTGSLGQFSQRAVLPCVSTCRSAHGHERRNGLRKRRGSDAAQAPAQSRGGLTLTKLILRECEGTDAGGAVPRCATAPP